MFDWSSDCVALTAVLFEGVTGCSVPVALAKEWSVRNCRLPATSDDSSEKRRSGRSSNRCALDQEKKKKINAFVCRKIERRGNLFAHRNPPVYQQERLSAGTVGILRERKKRF